MSRPLRLEFAGAIWHVTSRGNERRNIFRDDTDRLRFLAILGRTIESFGWKLHAYVLMNNHYHLLLETPEPTLSRGMRELNGIYTQAFNRRHHRVGHLFQGRFKAVLVERESHLLELCRYIVLNPVRSGTVRAAREWPWSSYRATAGLVPTPPWLETRWALQQFGTRDEQALQRYRQFVSEGKEAGYDPWSRLRGQIYLGSGKFLRQARARATAKPPGRGVPRRQQHPDAFDPSEIMNRSAQALGVTLPDLIDHPRLRARERALVAFALRRFGLAKLREVGGLLGVGEWRASAMAAAGEALVTQEPRWLRDLETAIESRTHK